MLTFVANSKASVIGKVVDDLMPTFFFFFSFFLGLYSRFRALGGSLLAICNREYVLVLHHFKVGNVTINCPWFLI